MKEFVTKFVEFEERITAEKGALFLFALFLRESALNDWDVVLCGPWTDRDTIAARKYVAERIQNEFALDDLMKLSRVVIIEPGNPGLAEILERFHLEHGVAEVRNEVFFGLEIKRGYIITSQQLTSEPALVEAATA